ncbi:hypothetical protein BCIN_05g04340 [Botrytis cinerea B05.10]|uniref:non-specific serine/threonine protein kinase n=1 Tax=Botryotinia fuckeliana (strain B05.10) TaxID=332648 RepID=A0A384JI33_BOTFB|nr:hypothetical protein BCIN_05g04340 [Botrytis cinerea B05.10]ATZ50044.1 hypothetical protein BCIN_05g04340 [Botrytis cinerea B05.10]
MAAAPQEGHVPGAGGIIVDVNVDVDLDTESPTEQPWEDVGISNLTNQSDYMAVRVLRAFRANTVRQNKWLKDNPHNLTGDNIEVEACIASGTFGLVFLVENKDTRSEGQPGLKYAVKISKLRLESDANLDYQMGSDHSPTLTRTSDASVVDPKQIKALSLTSKRGREITTFLQYIKSGHPNVMNLSGWAEFDNLGNPFSMLVLEICDLGTLSDMVSEFRDRDEFIPEGFIWHVFEQLFSGLAFLHGEHPQYVTKPEFAGRTQTTVARDVKSNNIFIQSLPANSPPNTYPNIKLGDFGESLHLPRRGTRNYNYGNSTCDPPDNKMSAKYDVWSVGTLIYMMARRGYYPNKGCSLIDSSGRVMKFHHANSEQKELLLAARNKESRFEPINEHLTLQLETQIRWALTLNRNDRPRSVEVYTRVQKLNNERKRFMYRELPEWAPVLQLQRQFKPLELVKREWMIEDAEERDFLFEYAGGLTVRRLEKERNRVRRSLAEQQAMIQRREDEKQREVNLRTGVHRHAEQDRARRRVIEQEEIDKVNKERVEFGGWLQSGYKRRRLEYHRGRAHWVD